MRYLFGDSTESGLDFNYLAFLRDIIDAAVVLVECDFTLATTDERKKTKERDANLVIASIEELGKRTAHLVSPFVKEREESAVGRCATAIAIAAKEAIEKESREVRAGLATALAAIESENVKLRKRSVEIFDKLLKTHDLPGAEKVYEVAWTSSGLKAAMRQRTAFGIEAVLALDLPSNSVFTTDLRVDKIVEGVEINALESGGWLKKSDKLVPHKLGRYHITRVVVGADVTVRVRSTGEANASAFEITTDRGGEIRIDRLGGQSTAREFSIEDHNQPKLRQLTDKLAAAARALAEHRTTVVAVEVDGVALADHTAPRAIAERLVLAIAPTVVKIAKHSRSPGELVLRRMLGDDRREEIFVTKAELQKKIDPLPASARDMFLPLQLVDPPEEEAAPQYTPPSLSGAARARTGKTIPPPSPPPPPPSVLKRPPPPPPGGSGASVLPGMPPLAISRTISNTIAVEELEELPVSSPAIVLPDESRSASPAAETLDAPSGGHRPARPTKPTGETLKREQAAVAATAESLTSVSLSSLMAAADDPAKEESAVALDVMKASPEDVTLEESARPKRESLGAAIDAAIDGAGADKSTSDQKPS